MIVKSAFYNVFYDVICAEIIEKEYKGDTSKIGKTLRGRLLWDKLSDEKFKVLFIGSSVSVNSKYYYYRQAKILNPKTVVAGHFDDDLLTNALLYIASAEIRKEVSKIAGGINRLEYLMKEFEKRHAESIHDIEANYRRLEKVASWIKKNAFFEEFFAVVFMLSLYISVR